MRIFLPQKPTCFTNFCAFIFILVLEGLRGDYTHATKRTEDTVQAQGKENWGLLRFIYL